MTFVFLCADCRKLEKSCPLRTEFDGVYLIFPDAFVITTVCRGSAPEGSTSTPSEGAAASFCKMPQSSVWEDYIMLAVKGLTASVLGCRLRPLASTHSAGQDICIHSLTFFLRVRPCQRSRVLLGRALSCLHHLALILLYTIA